MNGNGNINWTLGTFAVVILGVCLFIGGIWYGETFGIWWGIGAALSPIIAFAVVWLIAWLSDQGHNIVSIEEFGKRKSKSGRQTQGQ